MRLRSGDVCETNTHKITVVDIDTIFKCEINLYNYKSHHSTIITFKDAVTLIDLGLHLVMIGRAVHMYHTQILCLYDTAA